MVGVLNGQTIPNANDQCRIIYGVDTASYCQVTIEAVICSGCCASWSIICSFECFQSYNSSICSKLVCRLAPTDTQCNTITTIAAADGTPCGYNQVNTPADRVVWNLSEVWARFFALKACSGGTCVVGNININNNCLFGDNLIINQTIVSDPLPMSPMSCSDFMVYLINNGKSPFSYCSNSTFRSTCCKTCAGKNQIGPRFLVPDWRDCSQLIIASFKYMTCSLAKTWTLICVVLRPLRATRQPFT